MSPLHFFTVFTVFISLTDNAPVSRWEKVAICTELPLFVLESILGGAYNPHYMSVDQPIESKSSTGGKRGAAYEEDFFVDDNYIEQVDEQPAWSIDSHVQVARKRYGLHRAKRGVDYLQQWHCKSKIEWTDLGPDYFPRYLRSVVCLSDKCWFGVYKCKPKALSVKLLRRKKGFCAKGAENNRVGVTGLPKELTELWVWEERAVNFCCDCVRI